jgi:hypothetical protein
VADIPKVIKIAIWAADRPSRFIQQEDGDEAFRTSNAGISSLCDIFTADHHFPNAIAVAKGDGVMVQIVGVDLKFSVRLAAWAKRIVIVHAAILAS